MLSASATNQGTARDVAGWLALAAAPTFAFMAWMAANDAPSMAFCSSGPIGGMTAMYLLMSVLHLSPWLKVAAHLIDNQGDQP